MLRRFGWFVLGVIAAILTMVAGAYLFVKAGGVSMETTAKQFPLEKTLVRLALHASIGNAAQQKDALPFNDVNMMAGADIYKETLCVLPWPSASAAYFRVAGNVSPTPTAVRANPHARGQT